MKKRLIDLIAAFLLLVVLSPILLLVYVLVIIFLGSPALFVQERVGKDERIFLLYKFRTMSDRVDSTGALLPDEQRLSRFGRALRASSLDELPELWNVLRGDMSLVGPRPLLVEYLPLYNDRQRLRHSVKPGITGYAQINGRNSCTWQEKFEMDVWYVKNASLLLDIRILFSTVFKVLSLSGVTQEGQATMTKFTGNE